jgi:hypothetical protein
MQRYRLLILSGLLAAAFLSTSGAPALASAPLAIAATNVTMPSSGNGVSNFTITGIPGAGTVTIGCLYSGTLSIANLRIPSCTYGPVATIPVTAGQTLTGTIQFYPFGAAIPVGLHRTPRRLGHLSAAGLALAGALMLGFGLRRGRRRWFALALFAVGALAGMAGISGCGGLSNAMTPGTYQYTILTSYQDTASPILSAILNTNVEVTVQ